MTRPDVIICGPQEAPPFWDWPNFTPDEMRCKGTGRLRLVCSFMDALQALRIEVGRPFAVTSGYRSPEHNKAVGGGPAHPTGQAVDFAMDGIGCFDILAAAREHGFTGIGLRMHGPHDRRFMHLDTLRSGSGVTRPIVWTYK